MRSYSFGKLAAYLITMFVDIFLNSCAKDKVWNGTPMTYTPPPPSNQGAALSSATFWVVNLYDDNDVYWYNPSGFFRLEVGGGSQTVFYMLRSISNPACHDPTANTFYLSPGIQTWKLFTIGGNRVINTGTVNVPFSGCIVSKISF